MPTTTDQSTSSFLSYFQEALQQPSVVQKEAIAALDTLEVPTRKWEDWRYTSVRDLVRTEYTRTGLPIDSVEDALIPDFEAERLVFVNGVFSPALSQFGEGQVQVSPLAQASDALQALFETHHGELIDAGNIFSALNTAYAREGVVMFVPNNTVAEKPVHVLHIQQPGTQALGSQHRNLFLIGKNSQAKIVETYLSLGDGTSFRNQVDEVILLDNSELEYVKIQDESNMADMITHTSAVVAKDARFHIYTLTFGGNLVRNDLRIKLSGQNSHTELHGAYLLDGLQQVANHTALDHAVPNCTSNEMYKGILDDSSTGVFSGYIHVWPQAQKTNAFQSSRNIILSDNATMYTKPQLEIYADDVKCSHGATTGRIDEIALFYLRARGIPEREAKKIMIHAFVMEAIEAISMEEVKTLIEARIREKF